MKLLETINSLPHLCGVYKMYDMSNILIYVGKAKDLNSRVKSYTRQDISPKTKVLMQNVFSIEFEITPSEMDALILEASLVKKHQPKYNILLKDDKSRLYLKISNHQFPSIGKWRGKIDRKSHFFGPFGYGISTNQTIKYITGFVGKVFKIRSCKDSKFNVHKSCGKPCMEYQIKTCSGPCAGMISKQDYDMSVKEAIKFLHGNSNIYKDIKQRITNYAKESLFVEAENLKNQLLALERLKSVSSEINFAKFPNADSIVPSADLDKIEVFSVRNGYALGGNIFEINKPENKTGEEIIIGFMCEYYSNENPPPLKILLGIECDVEKIKAVIFELFGTKTSASCPKSGEGKVFVDFVKTNIDYHAKENVFASGMQLLKEAFNLSAVPNRVEVYDNSHMSGAFFTGAFVVASQSGFETNEYRKFNAKISKGGDDYAMMSEVLTRRLSGKIALPDLIIIDGGLGQFNVVETVLNSLGVNIFMIAIAKGRDRNSGNETFFTKENKDGFKLNNKKALLFIERLRDEAHRFVIASHRKRREKL